MYRFEQMFDTEENALEGQLEATNQKLATIGQLARKCLANGDFQQYKDLFEAELSSIMNAMVVYTANFGKNGNDNLEIYAINMIRFVQRISDLRKLLTCVELDAKKGIQQKDEKDGKE